MRTDIPMLDRVTLAALVLVLAGIALAAAVSLCGCDDDLVCLPDLRVEEIRVGQPVVPWEPTRTTVVVWNRGVAGAKAFRVELCSDGGTGWDWRAGGIGPRERTSFNGWLILPDECELSIVNVRAAVDPDDLVVEGCEANNEMTVTVVVGPSAEVTP